MNPDAMSRVMSPRQEQHSRSTIRLPLNVRRNTSLLKRCVFQRYWPTADRQEHVLALDAKLPATPRKAEVRRRRFARRPLRFDWRPVTNSLAENACTVYSAIFHPANPDRYRLRRPTDHQPLAARTKAQSVASPMTGQISSRSIRMLASGLFASTGHSQPEYASHATAGTQSILDLGTVRSTVARPAAHNARLTAAISRMCAGC